MVVPTREFGDFLVTDGAETLLFFPQAQQLVALSEVIRHFEAKTFLKIDFPLRVIWISFAFDFRVPLDGSIGGIPKIDRLAV